MAATELIATRAEVEALHLSSLEADADLEAAMHEIGRLEAALNAKEDEAEGLRGRALHLELALEGLRRKEGVYAKHAVDSSLLQAKLVAAEHQLSKAEQEAQALGARLKRTEEEKQRALASWTEEAQEADDRQEQARRQQREAAAALTAAQRELASARASQADLRDAKVSLEDTVTRLRQQLDSDSEAAKTEKDRLNSVIDGLRAELGLVTASKNHLETAKQALVEKQAESKRSTERVEDDLEQLKEAVRRALATSAEHQRQAQAAHGVIASLRCEAQWREDASAGAEDALQELEHRLCAGRDQNLALQEECARLSADLDRVKAEASLARGELANALRHFSNPYAPSHPGSPPRTVVLPSPPHHFSTAPPIAVVHPAIAPVADQVHAQGGLSPSRRLAFKQRLYRPHRSLRRTLSSSPVIPVRVSRSASPTMLAHASGYPSVVLLRGDDSAAHLASAAAERLDPFVEQELPPPPPPPLPPPQRGGPATGAAAHRPQRTEGVEWPRESPQGKLRSLRAAADSRGKQPLSAWSAAAANRAGGGPSVARFGGSALPKRRQYARHAAEAPPPSEYTPAGGIASPAGFRVDTVLYDTSVPRNRGGGVGAGHDAAVVAASSVAVYPDASQTFPRSGGGWPFASTMRAKRHARRSPSPPEDPQGGGPGGAGHVSPPPPGSAAAGRGGYPSAAGLGLPSGDRGAAGGKPRAAATAAAFRRSLLAEQGSQQQQQQQQLAPDASPDAQEFRRRSLDGGGQGRHRRLPAAAGSPPPATPSAPEPAVREDISPVRTRGARAAAYTRFASDAKQRENVAPHAYW